MGKIRLKTLGEDELEKQQAEKAERRREAKKARKSQEDVEETKAEVVASATEEVTVSAQKENADSADKTETDEKGTEKTATSKKSNKKADKKSVKSEKNVAKKGKNYLSAQKKVDPSKNYSLADAVKLVQDMAYAKFDETVEVHINLKKEGLKGEVTLPHGTGQEVVVAIADDKLLGEIDGGTINFDVLIASPAFMPKLVKYARILGPKGLMPNPKNGTVSENPEQAAKKFKSGGIHYKSEAKAPLIHQAVGKVSFKPEQLTENVGAFVKAVGVKNITDVYVSATMTPSVRVSIEKLS